MQSSILLLAVIISLTIFNQLVPTSTAFSLSKGTRSKPENLELQWGDSNHRQLTGSFKCSVLSYEIGHHQIEATCPFNLILDTDADRIPEKIIQQVCRGCRFCGPHQTCTQLILPLEVYYRNTNETLMTEIHSGCVCLLLDLGSNAIPFDI